MADDIDINIDVDVEDNDEIDGCVAVEEAAEENLDEEHVLGLVLFADVDPNDQAAVEEHRAEWVDLFAQTGGDDA